jgi:Family of unknown function (DUF5317)
MLMVAVFVLGILSVRLAGGDLRQLNELSIRWAPIAGVALVIQIAIISFWPAGWRTGHLIVHLGTYAALLLFLYANRRLPWLWVVAVGTVSNATAIAANGGVMPASASALAIAARTTGSGFANSVPLSHPRLLLLGDIIPTPSWMPLHNVASIGDLLVSVGAILVIWTAARQHRSDDHFELQCEGEVGMMPTGSVSS